MLKNNGKAPARVVGVNGESRPAEWAAEMLGKFIAGVVHLGLVALIITATLLLMARSGYSQELPELDWDKEVYCSQNATGEWVHMQCDDIAGKCLVAPSQTSEGVDLDRLQHCYYFEPSWQSRVDAGYTMVEAVAESPPGWMRDERGRVYQVTFDLFKRVYIGAGWEPNGKLGRADNADVATLDRVRFEMGLMASMPLSDDRSRHTFKAFEGNVVVDDLSVDGLFFAYDYSHRSRRPFLRITTFFGTPERFDLFMDAGFGVRLLDVRSERYDDKANTELNILDVHGAWDMYQSDDLYNRLRLYTGVGVGTLWSESTMENGNVFVAPNVGAEARFGVDNKGLHYLEADVRYTTLYMLDDNPVEDDFRQRVEMSTAYEWIFLAINDQPLSLRLEAQADYRDDVPTEGPFWDLKGLAGLRFSFWAPAREDSRYPYAQN